MNVGCFKLKELHRVEEKEGADESEPTQSCHVYILQTVVDCCEGPKPCANCQECGESQEGWPLLLVLVE